MVHNQRRRGQKSNANNQRVKKTNTDTNETTLYAWTRDRIFGEYDAQGTPLQETVYLGNTPVGIIKFEGVYRIYADQIHAPRMITENLNNQTLWEWSSQPFGETQPNEDVDNDSIKLSYNLRFPGQYYDQESHKYYNYNRYYDPSTGSYMMSDPMGLLGGLNSYGYVDANPLIRTDPKGLLFGFFDGGSSSCYAVGQRIACVSGQTPPPIGGRLLPDSTLTNATKCNIKFAAACTITTSIIGKIAGSVAKVASGVECRLVKYQQCLNQ